MLHFFAKLLKLAHRCEAEGIKYADRLIREVFNESEWPASTNDQRVPPNLTIMAFQRWRVLVKFSCTTVKHLQNDVSARMCAGTDL